MTRLHLADVAVADQFAHIQQARVALRLQPTAVRSELAFASLAISWASARLAPSGHSQKTFLPASSACMTSAWWPGTRTQTDHQVDVGVGEHGLEVVEGELGAERFGGGFGRVGVGGAHRFELVLRQRAERGDVRVGAPATATLCHGGADDAYPDLAWHTTRVHIEVGP